MEKRYFFQEGGYFFLYEKDDPVTDPFSQEKYPIQVLDFDLEGAKKALDWFKNVYCPTQEFEYIKMTEFRMF